MNVFVLSTGRCGSLTFAQACRHLDNYTAGHETNWGEVGPGRLSYPPDHIESDNRLSWLLGRLDERYGDAGFYVHLRRDPTAVAASYNRRWHMAFGIVSAYDRGVLTRGKGGLDVCEDYIETVNANIELFLRDKARTMTIDLETVTDSFPGFLERIGATGDLDAARDTWEHPENASEQTLRPRPLHPLWRKFGRIGRYFPEYVRRI